MKMDRKSIEQFFESLPKDVLKEKWKKYDKYSENESNVTVSDLIDVWNVYYENTFVFYKPDLLSDKNILVEESELSFGLFF